MRLDWLISDYDAQLAAMQARFEARMKEEPRLLLPKPPTFFDKVAMRMRQERPDRYFTDMIAAYQQLHKDYKFWQMSGQLRNWYKENKNNLFLLMLAYEVPYLFAVHADFSKGVMPEEFYRREELLGLQQFFMRDPENFFPIIAKIMGLAYDQLFVNVPRPGNSPFVVRTRDVVGPAALDKFLEDFRLLNWEFSHDFALLYINPLKFLFSKIDANRTKIGLWYAKDYQGDDAIRDFLGGTPYEPFFAGTTKLHVPAEVWFEHAHIVAASGGGKTQFLSQLFLTLKNHGAVVCVDSQGDWIGKLKRLKSIQHRVLYIDPRNPPTVNLFKADILDYLFSVKGSSLTPKQSVFFSMLTKLMRVVPNSTMMDVLRALHDIAPYQKYVEQLPEIPRLFFERDYNSKTFTQTKEEIRYRINLLIEHPTMAKLFTSSAEAIDIGRELDRYSIILIDTSLEYLKGASPAFGKIFIALMLEAVQERAAVPENERKHAYFLCDEAAAYFDQNITDLLEMARKYKLACFFAHQHLSQCTPELRAALMGSTSIKIATQCAVEDARALAPNMRTTQEFIMQQPKLTFALYVRGVTASAVALKVTPGLLEREEMVERHEPPRRTAHDEFNRNEAEASPTQSTTEPVKPSSEPTKPSPEPDVTEASDTW